MKKIFLLTAFLILAWVSIFAQNTEKQIAAIRAEVAAIEKAGAKYTQTTKDIEGMALEGTQAVYYSSGKGLKKIAAKLYGESYNATLEFYYQGEELIFVFQKLNKYVMPVGAGKVRIASVEETRTYFAGGKLIRLLDGKKQVAPGSIEFDEAEYRMIELSDQFKAAFKP